MSAASAAPASPDPYANYRELTLRGMVLGALITVVFTASNVYLGLKVGLTFASSIPAAVISMALLRFAHGSNILENNMVQTQASAAGTLSSVIFILPGLLMAGYWSGFPFWQTVLLCTSGGILGVIFTIPLRLAMVVHTDLPYPEGVAAAEILKVGCPDPHFDDKIEGQTSSGIKEIITGGVITSAGVVLATTFAALAVIPLIFLVQLAFIVAFGVLLDAILVRAFLVPALVEDLGGRIWWPSRLR